MNILITGHHSLGNRGCEALLRSTVGMIRKRHPSSRFWVPSSRPSADASQWPEHADSGVEFIDVPKSSLLLRSWARACETAPLLSRASWPRVEPPASWRRVIGQVELTLSIGGDNYTLDYGLESLAYHAGVNSWSIRQGVPVVLWGASIGPFSRADLHARSIGISMQRHLGRLAGISVRESLTQRHLDQILGTGPAPSGGLPRGRRLVTDPAFNLEAHPAELQRYWPEGDAPVVGLNISPYMVADQGGTHSDDRAAGGLGLDELAGLVRQRCESGEFRFVLIPHVTARNAEGVDVHSIGPGADDEVLLDRLSSRLAGVRGVGRIPAWDAPRLKYAIAACDLFIGARTHSVIAALSSMVPAVALAYSVKAHGIHRDLFGHEDGVLDRAGLSKDSLDHALGRLALRSTAEKARLLTLIPDWRAKAMHAMDLLTP